MSASLESLGNSLSVLEGWTHVCDSRDALISLMAFGPRGMDSWLSVLGDSVLLSDSLEFRSSAEREFRARV